MLPQGRSSDCGCCAFSSVKKGHSKGAGHGARGPKRSGVSWDCSARRRIRCGARGWRNRTKSLYNRRTLEWRNWQTRETQNLVAQKAVGVQLPPPAPALSFTWATGAAEAGRSEHSMDRGHPNQWSQLWVSEMHTGAGPLFVMVVSVVLVGCTIKVQ